MLDQEKLNLLYPVIGNWMFTFIELPCGIRLISCLCALGRLEKEPQASKQRMSKWIVKAIRSTMTVRAHSSRSMVASKNVLSGVSLQYVCDPRCLYMSCASHDSQ